MTIHPSAYVADKFIQKEKPPPTPPKSEKNYEDQSIDSDEVYQEIKKQPKPSFGVISKMQGGIARKVLGQIVLAQKEGKPIGTPRSQEDQDFVKKMTQRRSERGSKLSGKATSLEN